jgi:hypothetical protein
LPACPELAKKCAVETALDWNGRNSRSEGWFAAKTDECCLGVGFARCFLVVPISLDEIYNLRTGTRQNIEHALPLQS